MKYWQQWALSGDEPPINPLREAIALIVRSEHVVPIHTERAYSCADLTDAEVLALQDYCSMNVRPQWMTGIGTIEAAELMVREAVSNGNIPNREELKEYLGK